MSELSAGFETALDRIAEAGLRCALIGGFAVSARTEPRFTRDIDLVVAVADDDESERLVQEFISHGHSALATIEQDAVERLAGVRLRLAGGEMVDLLFASSGIEAEIVADAEKLEILPGLMVPVARAGHLLVLKLLARDDRERPQDVADLRALSAGLSDEERRRAQEAAALVDARGFGRGRDVSALLKAALADDA